MADSLKMPIQQKKQNASKKWSKYSEICQAQPYNPDFSGEAIHKLWKKKSFPNKTNQQEKKRKDAHTHVCPAKGQYPSILHFFKCPFFYFPFQCKRPVPPFGTDPMLAVVSGRVCGRAQRPPFFDAMARYDVCSVHAGDPGKPSCIWLCFPRMPVECCVRVVIPWHPTGQRWTILRCLCTAELCRLVWFPIIPCPN
ncbi:hypothetical protein M440DRAFT_1270077 [Trichoderma longibrachiatum ATCC 18648]|uniref:Uncharacterized protein n=1 Tax=Trichoderma longibrachiatum ATCC 18648 TaxID=983965 RepID=A0A2T4C0S8_TRILO|nr:hypothetical protein M440DRAFT_1270077 [Trichoderma longibrachiatum ATCC 18648]